MASGYRLSLNAFLCSACSRSRSFSSAATCFLNISARPMIESRLPPKMMLEHALPTSDMSGLRTESFSETQCHAWAPAVDDGVHGRGHDDNRGNRPRRGHALRGKPLERVIVNNPRGVWGDVKADRGIGGGLRLRHGTECAGREGGRSRGPVAVGRWRRLAWRRNQWRRRADILGSCLGRCACVCGWRVVQK
ncbi:hypothetical protein DFH94DRAFT_301922 [Russula ochroleuca]|uniref:Uncharacterized protein n=1 Tax=Russula ochroleuca TaxID=152965 RepID=A0A9P5JVH7_9AGAM|nr:hypothetical protein DFH94DRAFT_301922 [Russula ochroleuca]